MGCVGLAAVWGSIIFGVVGVVWWRIAGHRPPLELAGCYLAFVGFVAYCAIDSYINRWREQTKETAEGVRKILSRLDDLERTIRYKD
jgi:hypothetical protein